MSLSNVDGASAKARPHHAPARHRDCTKKDKNSRGGRAQTTMHEAMVRLQDRVKEEMSRGRNARWEAERTRHHAAVEDGTEAPWSGAEMLASRTTFHAAINVAHMRAWVDPAAARTVADLTNMRAKERMHAMRHALTGRVPNRVVVCKGPDGSGRFTTVRLACADREVRAWPQTEPLHTRAAMRRFSQMLLTPSPHASGRAPVVVVWDNCIHGAPTDLTPRQRDNAQSLLEFLAHKRRHNPLVIISDDPRGSVQRLCTSLPAARVATFQFRELPQNAMRAIFVRVVRMLGFTPPPSGDAVYRRLDGLRGNGHAAATAARWWLACGRETAAASASSSTALLHHNLFKTTGVALNAGCSRAMACKHMPDGQAPTRTQLGQMLHEHAYDKPLRRAPEAFCLARASAIADVISDADLLSSWRAGGRAPRGVRVEAAEGLMRRGIGVLRRGAFGQIETGYGGDRMGYYRRLSSEELEHQQHIASHTGRDHWTRGYSSLVDARARSSWEKARARDLRRGRSVARSAPEAVSLPGDAWLSTGRTT